MNFTEAVVELAEKESLLGRAKRGVLNLIPGKTGKKMAAKDFIKSEVAPRLNTFGKALNRLKDQINAATDPTDITGRMIVAFFKKADPKALNTAMERFGDEYLEKSGAEESPFPLEQEITRSWSLFHKAMILLWRYARAEPLPTQDAIKAVEAMFKYLHDLAKLLVEVVKGK